MKMLRHFFRAWRDMRRFQSLESPEKTIVFYSEGADYWKFFAPIVEQLVKTQTQPIIWLTSDSRDPLLVDAYPGIDAFFIGDRTVRTIVLNKLRANLLIMTMPDLGNFYIKRSVADVHYMYLFHSMVSMHMIYGKGAFDHYDSILCVGDHHIEEIREWEGLNKLPPKQLFKSGYGVLDQLLEEKKQRPLPSTEQVNHVLVAPSWGPRGLLETRGVETVEVLLEAGFQVTVRPHPMTRKLAPQKISELINRFGGHPSFSFDTDQGSNDSLHAANIMVSDWSGVALEFAFGLEKPVIFVDVPLKLNNAEYSRLKAIPIEISLRDKIGTILPAEDIEKLPAVVAKLTGPPEGLAKELRGLRERYVYNVGKSAVTAANIINELVEARGSRQRQ